MVSPPVYSLVDLTVSGKTSGDAGFGPGTGYNYKADGITFTMNAGDNIGVTGGISVDNNNGVAGTPFAGSVLNFTGSSQVAGTVGPTNPISTINLNGAGSIVRFAGDVTLSTGIVMTADGTLTFADGVDLISGSIDNTAGAGKGTILFEGSTVTHGIIGNTNPFLLIKGNSNGGAGTTTTFDGPLVKATTININDNGVAGSTLLFDNAIGEIVGNITAKTNNLDTLNLNQAATLTGNIGTNATGFLLVKVGAQDDTAVTGNIFAKTAQFQADNTLTLADGNSITGNVDSTGAGNGTLEFLGAGGVTGTIGATNALNQVDMDGAGKTVSLGGNTKVANGVNFTGATNTASVLNIADGVTLTGNLDNKTLQSAGIVNFAGTGVVTGTAGATQAINTINLNGGAGNKCEFPR